MPQVVTLMVSKELYADITVTVPDGFDARLLMRAINGKHIKKACDELDADFEENYLCPNVRVENVQVHTDPADAEQQLKDFRHVDLAEAAPELFAKTEGG